MPFASNPYFTSDPRRWTPELFGAACLSKTPDYSSQRILDIYVKSLSHISLDQQTTERRRNKAEYLLEKYRENDVVKDLLKALWVAGRGTSPVVINNSTVGLLNTGNFENNGSLEVETRKRPSGNVGGGGDNDINNGVADGGNTQGQRKRPRTISTRESFIRKYEAMDDSSMWKLSTGKVVEKCIYEGVIGSSSVEGLAYMWIISSKDPWMRDLFTTKEWGEILSSRVVQKVTEPTQSCWDLLLKFKNVTTIEELEVILFGAVPQMGKHTEWVYNVMRQMRILLKHPRAPLLSDHGENWYEVNVWGPIIDHLFLLAAEKLEVDRKEIACSATTFKLNEDRTQTGKGHYLVSGGRSDAIIRATNSQSALEYGAIEAKPFFAGKTSTTFLDDYNKLTRTLGDMMARLVESVNTLDASKVEVIGLVLAGLHYQAVRMWTPNGNVYVASPDALYQIPTCVERLGDMVPLLFSVWQMMKTIGTCLEAVDASDRYGHMTLKNFL